jgi:hypothetical protein
MTTIETPSSKKPTSAEARLAMTADARLKYISQVHRRALDTRRTYEWKTVAATLAFYVLVSAASLREGVVPKGELQKWFIAAVIAAVAVVSFYYLRFLHRANKLNKDIAHAAENALIDKAGVEDLTAARNAARDSRTKSWSFLGEISIVVAFAAASAVILLRGP